MDYQRTNHKSNNGFIYEEITEWGGGLAITGYEGDAKDVILPDEIDGKAVLVVAKDAFNEKGLDSIGLPRQLKEIKEGAFSKNNLMAIVFPDDVEVIGYAAFQQNKLQGTIHLPAGLRKIEAWAFAENLLEHLYIYKDDKIVGII